MKYTYTFVRQISAFASRRAVYDEFIAKGLPLTKDDETRTEKKEIYLRHEIDTTYHDMCCRFRNDNVSEDEIREIIRKHNELPDDWKSTMPEGDEMTMFKNL